MECLICNTEWDLTGCSKCGSVVCWCHAGECCNNLKKESDMSTNKNLNQMEKDVNKEKYKDMFCESCKSQRKLTICSKCKTPTCWTCRTYQCKFCGRD